MKPVVSRKLASLAHAHPFSKAGAGTLGKRDEIKKKERELTGEMQRLQAKVKCTQARKGEWEMSGNQVSNNLELPPPTLRENYKISNLK